MAAEQEWGYQFGRTLMDRTIQTTGWDVPREETDLEAWLALEELQKRLEIDARAIAQELPSAQWLWYLRRLSWLFAGRTEYPASGETMEEIAESVSSLSSAPHPTSVVGMLFLYPIDQEVARSLWRLNVVSTLLWGIAVRLLWVGKGAALRAVPHELPEPVATPDIVEANAAWDRRVAAWGTGFLARAGLYTHSLGRKPEPSELYEVVLLWGRTDRGFSYMSFFPAELRTLRTSELPIDIRWPTALLDLILLLVGYGWSEVIGVASDLAPLGRTGCRILPRSQALEETRLAIELLSAKRFGGVLPTSVSLGTAEEVLGRLAAPEISVWPASLGPAIRVDGDLVFEDLYAATARLETALARPRLSQSQDKAWATAFELSIQDAIDDSEWRPRPELRALQGRKVKDSQGAVITDIDAIGENAGRLLLVSCKCRPFSDAINRGKHQAVRETARLVDKWVSEWADRLSRIRGLPMIGTTDLSQFADITGPVVTPAPIWSGTVSTRTEIAPGLHAAMGAPEFGRWIRG
jgi:hypothetical protein